MSLGLQSPAFPVWWPCPIWEGACVSGRHTRMQAQLFVWAASTQGACAHTRCSTHMSREHLCPCKWSSTCEQKHPPLTQMELHTHTLVHFSHSLVLNRPRPNSWAVAQGMGTPDLGGDISLIFHTFTIIIKWFLKKPNWSIQKKKSYTNYSSWGRAVYLIWAAGTLPYNPQITPTCSRR